MPAEDPASTDRSRQQLPATLLAQSLEHPRPAALAAWPIAGSAAGRWQQTHATLLDLPDREAAPASSIVSPGRLPFDFSSLLHNTAEKILQGIFGVRRLDAAFRFRRSIKSGSRCGRSPDRATNSDR